MKTLFKFQTQGGREVTYLDAEGVYQPNDIRSHWASTFPELAQAQADEETKTQTVKYTDADGQEQEVEVERVVTFTKKVGTKG